MQTSSPPLSADLPPKGCATFCVGDEHAKMLEREMQELLWRYSDKLLNEPLKQVAWETSSGVGRADLVFEDRHGRLLIVEVKRGKLPRGAIDQLLDYFGMLKQRNPDRSVELMVVANVIPSERRLACESRDIECREISEKKFREVAEEVGFVFTSESTATHKHVEALRPTASPLPKARSAHTYSGPRQAKVYDTFLALMDAELLPLRGANPTHTRLDGNRTGGNREVAGRFRHQGKVWKIHADTHYEPLKLAYDALKTGGADPFVQAPTSHGKCLVLQDAVRRLMTDPRSKHMYIYEEGTT
jgi:Endonuclease NucS C-terminal domain